MGMGIISGFAISIENDLKFESK